MTANKLIAVAAEDNHGLQGQVSAHFGRCPHYVLVSLEQDRLIDSRVVTNPHYGSHRPGMMPQFIARLGANVIVAGGMGPRAIEMFHQMGIDVVTGAVGQVQTVLDDYLQGQLSGIVPCKHDHPDSCGDHGPNADANKQAAIPTKAGTVVISVLGAGNGLSATLDGRFGRAERFLLVDADREQVLKSIDNGSVEAAHGAGTSAAALVKSAGARAVVSGSFGPKALQALHALGIAAWSAPADISAEQALRMFKQGKLQPAP